MSTGLGPHLRLLQLGVFVHWCPACDRPHESHLRSTTHPQRRKWDWNDNMARPTFWPDFHVSVGTVVCHYFITDRHIEFLADSTHVLAGRTVPLPIFPPPTSYQEQLPCA